MKSFFSACTVFKTTSNAGLRHESNKSLAIRKRRFFRPTAQGSSFFNPSETRRVLNWLQSVFGARDQPGSLTASRRTTDGIPPTTSIFLALIILSFSAGAINGPHEDMKSGLIANHLPLAAVN